MTTFDLSPLYRSSVGFDRFANLLSAASRVDQNENGYPPYNIEVTSEDHYRITMAVAGFGRSELEIVSEPNKLVVSGKRGEEEEGQYLYRGIAGRSFERRFSLADHVKVEGARLENGLLHIELVRELPEAMKPQNITIESTEAERSDRVIEGERQAA